MVKTQEFVQKSRALHNNKYDYSKTDYKNSYTKVEIVCEHHGVFTQRPKDHLRSGGLHAGCPKCGDNKAARARTKSTEYFLEKARSIHGDKFDYSKVNYKHTHKNVKIICKKHNLEFEVTPSNFVGNVHNCPDCFKEINSRLDFTTEEFIDKCKAIHGELYDYSKVKYVGAFDKITIICSKHGEFLQSAYAHKNKLQGCPDCSTSKGELSVKSYLEENNIKFEQQKTFPGCTYKGLLKFDFYLPDNNTCIEFQGRQHFECVDYFGGEDGFVETQVRDKIKRDFCETNKINLICITKADDLEIALRKA
jgi:hypothetical protein